MALTATKDHEASIGVTEGFFGVVLVEIRPKVFHCQDPEGKKPTENSHSISNA